MFSRKFCPIPESAREKVYAGSIECGMGGVMLGAGKPAPMNLTIKISHIKKLSVL
jgi:hypothetical protein